jgi:NitT/TauT family transport system ATP-binding protein
MTSRPGKIKQIVDIPLGNRTSDQDIRTSPDFISLRHQVWTLLRDEVRKAALLERPGRVSDLLDADQKEVVGVG